MKWPADQMQIMLDGFKQFFENSQFDVTLIRERYKEDPWFAIWHIYRQVTYDLQYDNDHPAYHPGDYDGVPRLPRTRRVQHNPAFKLYPKGCNDTHLKTMLKHVATQIGLIG